MGPKGQRNYIFAATCTMKKPLEAIVFDLGGVILNIDYTRTEAAFDRLGFNTFGKSYSQVAQSALFDRFEKGGIQADEFRYQLQELGQFKASEQDIDDAWNAMLLDLPGERLELLSELAAEYSLFLLSNTNIIHITELSNYLTRRFGMSDLSSIFKKEYLSFEIGMRKPDAEIFEWVVKENKLDPAKTLFIDDSIQHIEGAKECGLQTHLLQKNQTILDLF